MSRWHSDDNVPFTQLARVGRGRTVATARRCECISSASGRRFANGRRRVLPILREQFLQAAYLWNVVRGDVRRVRVKREVILVVCFVLLERAGDDYTSADRIALHAVLIH